MSTQLTLPDTVGVAPAYIDKDGVAVPNPKAGEPEPIVSIGVPMQIPVNVDGEVVNSSQTYQIAPADKLKDGQWARIIPGTRTVEVAHEGLENVLRNVAGYVDVKKSTPKQSKED